MILFSHLSEIRGAPFSSLGKTIRRLGEFDERNLSYQFDSSRFPVSQPGKLTKRILAGYSGVTDDKLLEIAYDVYILKIRSKVPYPVAKSWKTRIDFTARDNPNVRGIKVEEVWDDSIIRELDESGFIKGWDCNRNFSICAIFKS